ncbi:MAG: MATE family efflux transporter [Pseudomonadota bacterium]
MSSRARILNERPLPALLRLAAPNVVAGLIQSLMIVAEAWFAGGLGPDALAGVALVFPLFMLSMMLSAGAFGGAVSGAMARAVGAGDMVRANAVLRLAVVIGLAAGGLKALALVVFGAGIFRVMGGEGPVLNAALEYGAVIFPALMLIWVTNMLSGALRGSGDMIRPAWGVALVVLVHFALLAGQRAMGYPLGLSGAAWASIGAYMAGFLFICFVLTRQNREVRLSLGGWTRLPGGLRLLGQGLLAGSQSLMTIGYSLIVTGVFASLGRDWLAGYGIGARLELLLIPVVFGIGGAAMVGCGTLAGAGRRADAIRMGWIATGLAGGILTLIGAVLALAPWLWTGLFTDEPAIAAAGAAYLGWVGPVYGFFGIGLCLYFASQGLDTLRLPVAGALLRLVIVCVGLWALAQTGTLGPETALAVVAASMVAYGGTVALALWLGPWSSRDKVTVPG